MEKQKPSPVMEKPQKQSNKASSNYMEKQKPSPGMEKPRQQSNKARSNHMERQKANPGMENPQKQSNKASSNHMEKQKPSPGVEKPQEQSNEALVWDCGSSLYDSFERNSFNHQLDSTIATRTYSMPRLSDHQNPFPTPISKQTEKSQSKKSSKISRSLQKFFRIVFRPKSTPHEFLTAEEQEDELYAVYDRYGGGLLAIPVAPECANPSLQIQSRVGRSVSERFRPVSTGISCT